MRPAPAILAFLARLAVASPLASLAFGVAGCDPASADTETPPAPKTALPPTRAQVGVDGGSSKTPTPAPSGSGVADKPPLQVLKVVFTSEVKNKEPVDKLDHAEPGQRVWVHVTLRNRADEARPISLAFRVNGDQRSSVDLKAESSWSYRTWAYNTLRATDTTGEVAVDVRDEGGAILASARLPIKKP